MDALEEKVSLICRGKSAADEITKMAFLIKHF